MFKGKKKTTSYGGLKTRLLIPGDDLTIYQCPVVSLKNGGGCIGIGMAYTGVLKIIGSAPLLFSGFFTPLLRSIAQAVVHPIMGMLEYRKALGCPMTVRHPHLNWWISKSQIIGGLK